MSNENVTNTGSQAKEKPTTFLTTTFLIFRLSLRTLGGSVPFLAAFETGPLEAVIRTAVSSEGSNLVGVVLF